MNLKKGIALALTAAALMAFTGCGSNGTTSNGEYKVGVVQLVEHPALDAANKGFVDALKEKGLADKITFDQQNAQADNFSHCYTGSSIYGECNSRYSNLGYCYH